MKRMKLFSTIAVLMLSFSLVACGSKKQASNEVTTTKTEQSTTKKQETSISSETTTAESDATTDVSDETTAAESENSQDASAESENTDVEVVNNDAPEPATAEPYVEPETQAPVPDIQPAEVPVEVHAPTVEEQTEPPKTANNMPVPFYTLTTYNGYNGFFFPRSPKDTDMVASANASYEASVKWGTSNTMEIFTFDDVGTVSFQSFYE